MLTYSEWITQKFTTAQAIANGCCGGGYAEGALILCATISAMSALAWPEKKLGKKRFVEIITKFPPDTLDPMMVSMPLLAKKGADWNQRLSVTQKAFYLTTKTVDKTEEDVLSLCAQSCPSPKNIIRQFSYAHLLYKSVRCGFAHEYKIENNASNSDQLRKTFGVCNSQISYVINSQDPTMRLIHFSLEWISEVATSIARGLDAECARQKKEIFEPLHLPQPNNWWIEGI